MNIDLKQLRDLMRALKQLDVSEFEIEQGEERIFLRRGAPPAATLAVPSALTAGHGAGFSPLAEASVPPPSAPPQAAEAEDPSIAYVTSPFVGTFYRAPSPGASPFVEEGMQVTPGQVLCIVEAMKLMNEIEAEIAGTIVEVLVENGKPVEYGDQLFKVRKSI